MAHHFNQYAAEGNKFLKEYAKALGDEENIDKAGRILKSMLHALRNQLSIEESLQLIAQLPMVLKAMYVHEWSLHNKNKAKTVERLVQQIKDIHGKISSKDFLHDDDIEHAFVVSFITLRRYISLGELDDIKSILPKELKPLLNTVLMV